MFECKWNILHRNLRMGFIVTYFHDLRLLRIVSGAKTCLKLVKAFRDPTVLTWLKKERSFDLNFMAWLSGLLKAAPSNNYLEK